MADSKALLNIGSAYKVFDKLNQKSQNLIKLINTSYSCDEICQELKINPKELSIISRQIVSEYSKELIVV